MLNGGQMSRDEQPRNSGYGYSSRHCYGYYDSRSCSSRHCHGTRIPVVAVVGTTTIWGIPAVAFVATTTVRAVPVVVAVVTSTGTGMPVVIVTVASHWRSLWS